jgi:hypothetical protein
MRGSGGWTRVAGAGDKVLQVQRHQFVFTAPAVRYLRVGPDRAAEGWF